MNVYYHRLLGLIGWIVIAAAAAAGPNQEPKDVSRTGERIVQNAREAGKKLEQRDTGLPTRSLQQKVLEDIDALIRQAQTPPPDQQKNSSNGSNNMPMKHQGGGNVGQPKDNSSQSSTSGNQNGSQGPGRNSQHENPDPMHKTNGQMAGTKEPQGLNNAGNSTRMNRRDRNRQHARQEHNRNGTETPARATSLHPQGPIKSNLNRIEALPLPQRPPEYLKDVWGHLPEKMRQEMDLYFRDQFMPRYSELLQQYYASLAAQDKAKVKR